MVADAAQTGAVSRIIRFRELLPREYKQGNSWRYRGLQGPIDNALVRLAAVGKNDELRVESSWQLLDAVFSSLEKTARNKTYREREPVLELLPLSWIISLLENTREITTELKIALALATLKPETAPNTSSAETKNRPAPLIAYRVGVVPRKKTGRTIKIAKDTPLRVVWSQRDLTDNLCAILRRRIAVESGADAKPPCNTQLSLSLADALSFLNKETDDMLIIRWLERFMLFDWHFVQQEERRQLSAILQNTPSTQPLSPEEMLHAFFRPLFHAYTFGQLAPNIFEAPKTPTANALRPLVALLERGDSAAAHRAATNRYKSLLQTTADFGDNAFTTPEPRRLLASLLLPANSASIVNAFARWTTPGNKQQAP
jgi:CRISPR-associated protein Csx17